MKKYVWGIILLLLILVLGYIFGNKDLTLNLGDTYYVFNLFHILTFSLVVLLVIYFLFKGIRKFKAN